MELSLVRMFRNILQHRSSVTAEQALVRIQNLFDTNSGDETSNNETGGEQSPVAVTLMHSITSSDDDNTEMLKQTRQDPQLPSQLLPLSHTLTTIPAEPLPCSINGTLRECRTWNTLQVHSTVFSGKPGSKNYTWTVRMPVDVILMAYAWKYESSYEMLYCRICTHVWLFIGHNCWFIWFFSWFAVLDRPHKLLRTFVWIYCDKRNMCAKLFAKQYHEIDSKK